MAQAYDKSNIDSILTQHSSSNKFNTSPDRSKLSKNVPTLVELVSVVAETFSELLSQEQIRTATINTQGIKIGPSGQQKPSAYKDGTVTFDATTDPKFFAWVEAFHAFLDGVYPEPGSGSPNVFATAWKGLVGQKPTSLTGKIVSGSQNVKITI